MNELPKQMKEYQSILKFSSFMIILKVLDSC